MLAFSRQWDPQSFHIDDEAAAASHFGQIIGSGTYSIAVFQRLAVHAVYRHWAVIAGRRITQVEFRRPVIAGMDLLGTLTILDNRPVAEYRSLLGLRGTLAADGEVVMSMAIEVYVARDPSRPLS